MRGPFRAGIAAIVAALTIAVIPSAAQQSRWGADYFPNVTLTTQDGKTVRFYDDLIKGKIVAVNLIYTTCTYACPLETARLAQVQRVLGDRVGREVFFYSITIDPEHDTPQVLKDYAAKFHAGPGWLFLTGRQEDIDLIGRKLGLYAPPDPANPDGHKPNLLVGNEATGQWMRNSSLDNPKFLARTIGDWLDSWQGPKRQLKSFAEAPALTLDRGEYTFRNHCAACHTVGSGDHIGPDLAGVTSRRSRDWLARFIQEPDKLLAAGDPVATALFDKYKSVRMPNLALSQEDVDVVIDYLAKPSSGAPAAAATATGLAAKAVAVSPDPPRQPPFIDPYLRIQEALSADTLAGVKDAAAAVAREAAKLGVAGAPMRGAAEAFQQTSDLATTRSAFARLGDAITTYARTMHVSLGADVKLAYCPMARKYWVQKGTAIRNPYYGKSMLECGRLTDGLPTAG